MPMVCSNSTYKAARFRASLLKAFTSKTDEKSQLNKR